MLNGVKRKRGVDTAAAEIAAKRQSSPVVRKKLQRYNELTQYMPFELTTQKLLENSKAQQSGFRCFLVKFNIATGLKKFNGFQLVLEWKEHLMGDRLVRRVVESNPSQLLTFLHDLCDNQLTPLTTIPGSSSNASKPFQLAQRNGTQSKASSSAYSTLLYICNRTNTWTPINKVFPKVRARILADIPNLNIINEPRKLAEYDRILQKLGVQPHLIDDDVGDIIDDLDDSAMAGDDEADEPDDVSEALSIHSNGSAPVIEIGPHSDTEVLLVWCFTVDKPSEKVLQRYAEAFGCMHQPI